MEKVGLTFKCYDKISKLAETYSSNTFLSRFCKNPSYFVFGFAGGIFFTFIDILLYISLYRTNYTNANSNLLKDNKLSCT